MRVFEQKLYLADVEHPDAGESGEEIAVVLVVAQGGEDDGILIKTLGGSQLVVIENYGGKLFCHVWANGEADDPTTSEEIAIEEY